MRVAILEVAGDETVMTGGEGVKCWRVGDADREGEGG